VVRSSISARYSSWRSLFASLLLAFAPFSNHGSTEERSARQIVVRARRFSFSPAEITLKKGRTAKLILISEDVTHGLVVEGLGIDVAIHQRRETVVWVTPTKAGDFSGSCSIFCGTGHRDMEFVIHVVN
jgi:cytochrome c oxidase subunit 2